MHDIHDYLKRLGTAVLLCPVAAAVWFAFALSGFSVDGLIAYLGTLSQQYAGMSQDDQALFRFQIYAIWGVLAFGFLLISFALNPPRFRYRLIKEQGRWSAKVLDTHC